MDPIKRISSAIFPAAVFLLAPFHAMRCQEIASLRAGEPVRVIVASPTSQRIQGRLVSLSADTIVLRAKANSLPIPLSTVRLLEVKRRTSGSVAKSVVVGALGGAVGAAFFGLASGDTNTGDGRITAGDKGVIGLVLGGGVGLIGGTIFGTCCSSAWQRVPLTRDR
jgi:hypothetical protein